MSSEHSLTDEFHPYPRFVRSNMKFMKKKVCTADMMDCLWNIFVSLGNVNFDLYLLFL